MSIIRIKHNKEHPYVIINKKSLWDQRLSLEAAGLWARLLSRPDDWEIYVTELCESCGCGTTKIYRVLNELIDTGYAYRQPSKDKSGRYTGYDYYIFETSKTPEEIQIILPQRGFQHTEPACTVNQQLLSTDPVPTKDNTNIPTSTTGPSSDAELLAEEFAVALKVIHPEGFKPPNLVLWAKEFERMLRLDNLEAYAIRKVMHWAIKDPFWSSNILSPKKLREKYLQLKIRMENPLWKQQSKKKQELIKANPDAKTSPTDPDILAQLFPNC